MPARSGHSLLPSDVNLLLPWATTCNVRIDTRMAFNSGLFVVTTTGQGSHEHWLDIADSVRTACQRAADLGWRVAYCGRNPTEIEKYLNTHIPIRPGDPRFPLEVLRQIRLKQRPVRLLETAEMGVRQLVLVAECDYWIRTFDHHDEAHAFVRDHGLQVLG